MRGKATTDGEGNLRLDYPTSPTWDKEDDVLEVLVVNPINGLSDWRDFSFDREVPERSPHPKVRRSHRGRGRTCRSRRAIRAACPRRMRRSSATSSPERGGASIESLELGLAPRVTLVGTGGSTFRANLAVPRDLPAGSCTVFVTLSTVDGADWEGSAVSETNWTTFSLAGAAPLAPLAPPPTGFTPGLEGAAAVLAALGADGCGNLRGRRRA